jgi:hypothetical protein
MNVISKSELQHGAAYLGTSRQGIVGTWDMRQQRFHAFTCLENGSIVQVKIPHIEDNNGREDVFEPVLLAMDAVQDHLT